MKKYILSIDAGTTSSRAILFDKNGKQISISQFEFTQIFPKESWVEHDPIEIWETQLKAIKEVVKKSGINPNEIDSIGITNQRETTVVWDKNTGKPYYNAIVWQDTRTDKICNALAEDGGQDRFRPKVGLPLATYFSGPKVKWVLENVDGVREAAEAGEAVFGNIDTWVIWWLTGGPNGGSHVTDVTNASRTMLMDLQTLQWDEEILQILGIPPQILPRIVPSSDSNTWGTSLKDGPLGAAIPVCG